MANQVFGMNREGARRTAETNRRVLDRLPDVGRRTRRVYTSGSGGNRGDVIDFEVLEWFNNADPEDPICDCVRAVVTMVQCGSSVQVGDEVLICDPSLCWFNMPAELLIGATGFATLMDRSGLLDNLSCPVLLYEFGIGDCIWVVRSICCRESAAYV